MLAALATIWHTLVIACWRRCLWSACVKAIALTFREAFSGVGILFEQFRAHDNNAIIRLNAKSCHAFVASQKFQNNVIKSRRLDNDLIARTAKKNKHCESL